MSATGEYREKFIPLISMNVQCQLLSSFVRLDVQLIQIVSFHFSSTKVHILTSSALVNRDSSGESLLSVSQAR